MMVSLNKNAYSENVEFIYFNDNAAKIEAEGRLRLPVSKFF